MERILIADTHATTRRDIRRLVESLPGAFSFAEASSCAAVEQLLLGRQVQHAIIDLFLPDGNTFPIIRQMKKYDQQVNILVHAAATEYIYATRVIQKGAKGFISKQAGIGELKNAVSCLLKGEIYISPQLRDYLFNPALDHAAHNPFDQLSDKELETVQYMVNGLSTKDIAQQMGMATASAGACRRRAFKKLDIRNLTELKEKFSAAGGV
jgi:two-component system invasion response regulator UvrY